MRDESQRTFNGGCGDVDEWDLKFEDADGTEDVDTEFEENGCQGGHKVCDDGCVYDPEYPVDPDDPQINVIPDPGSDGLTGDVYWDLYNEETTQSSYCDSPTNTCWDDINTSVYEGESIDWQYYCVL
ncbi:MAG: hypothetical protein ACTHJX_06980 [Terriglobales bacterium]